MTHALHVAGESKLRSVVRSPMHLCQEIGCQSGVWSCNMAGQPVHLVHGLNIGTVTPFRLSAMCLVSMQYSAGF